MITVKLVSVYYSILSYFMLINCSRTFMHHIYITVIFIDYFCLVKLELYHHFYNKSAKNIISLWEKVVSTILYYLPLVKRLIPPIPFRFLFGSSIVSFNSWVNFSNQYNIFFGQWLLRSIFSISIVGYGGCCIRFYMTDESPSPICL